MLTMSWHEDIKLDRIQSLREGGIWQTDLALVQIREEATNFMAKFSNTSALDVNANVYSDEENDTSSGSDAEDSNSSARYEYSDDDDVDDLGGDDTRVPHGVPFSASGKAMFEPDTTPSDASLDSDLDVFDEQVPAPDAAKTGETSSTNAETIPTSDPAGPKTAELAELSSANLEAGEAANPPSLAKATPATPTPTTAETPTTEAAPTVDLVVTETAAV